MSALSDLQSRVIAGLRKEDFGVAEIITLDANELYPPRNTETASWQHERLVKRRQYGGTVKEKVLDKRDISVPLWDLLRQVLDERPAPRWTRVFQIGAWWGVRGLRHDEVLVACDSRLCAKEANTGTVLQLVAPKEDD
jgi:hypothetical protein